MQESVAPGRPAVLPALHAGEAEEGPGNLDTDSSPTPACRREDTCGPATTPLPALGGSPGPAQHGAVRKHSPAIRGATTSLGFAPALVIVLLADYLFTRLSAAGLMMLSGAEPFFAGNTIANNRMLAGLAAAYLLWILALARGWVTAATGGGFVIAGTGLCLRVVVEMPALAAQVPLARMRPPEPYATSLVFARDLGLIAFAFGLACVLAACMSERRLRRAGPVWTLPR